MAWTAGAQTDNYIPPSPTAASLALSSDIQMGEYTGIPSISPAALYVDVEGDISLPIALNYQSSGIKVEQEASWVGLGWSLRYRRRDYASNQGT